MFPSDELPRELLTWDDIDKLIDHLLPQFNGEFEGIVMITRGGLIPGGILSEAMDIKNVHTAAIHIEKLPNQNISWPTFMQFPIDTLVAGRRMLVINNIWAKGRNLVIVSDRLRAAGAEVETAVLHYRPKSNHYPKAGPDYYGAITTNYVVYPWELPFKFGSEYLSSSFRPSNLD